MKVGATGGGVRPPLLSRVTLVFEKDAETCVWGTFADICCPIFLKFFNAHNSLYIYILQPIFTHFRNTK